MVTNRYFHDKSVLLLMCRSLLTALLFLIFIFPYHSLIAADEEVLAVLYGNEEMVSIATGTSKAISKAPAVASVVTQQEIQRIGAANLVQVLETIPGVHVAYDSIAYNPIITFRGIYSRSNAQILMLINSIPITTLFQGNRSLVWAGMPVESISRIEVIRGPSSAIYGAEAFAGVINIITKDAKDINGSEFGVRYGSFNTKRAWFTHGKNYGGFDVALIAEVGTTDGHSEDVDSDLQTLSDIGNMTDASLTPGSTNNGRDNVDLRLEVEKHHWKFRTGLQRRKNVEVGFGVGAALDPVAEYESDRFNADLTYKKNNFLENFDVQAQVSYLNITQEVDEDTVLFPPGAFLVFPPPIPPVGPFPNGVIGNPEVWEKHWRFNAHADYSGIENHEIRIGSGYTTSEIYRVRETNNFSGTLTDVTDTPASFLPEKHRDNKYGYVQDVWNFSNDWELTLGLRYDDYNDFGDVWNPRAALVWSAGYNTTVKALYGEAFRAPSFSEFRNRNNPVALGNDELDPETIKTYELVIDSNFVNNLRIGANIFYYQWDDMISFVADPSTGTATAQNSGEQDGYGFELETEWMATPNFSMVANYAYQNSENKATNEDAGNAPHHQIYASANWEFLPGWYLTPEVKYIIDRDRPPGDTRSELDDYSVFNLVLRGNPVNDQWEMAVGVRNLFNSSPEVPTDESFNISNDLPLERRNFFATLRLNF